jgi:hypothetical protein
MTKKTRKGKTMLKPRVPTKLTSNIGKSGGGFARLATIQAAIMFLLKIRDAIAIYEGANKDKNVTMNKVITE